jgi:mono/diheme cytochrome c family protein
MRLTILALLAIAAATGQRAHAGGPTDCDDLGSVAPFTQFNYPLVIQSIWQGNCSGCHLSGGSSGGLNLDPPGSDLNLINVASTQNPAFTLVVPGDPLASLLFLKLNCDGPGLGSRMPLGGPNLSLTQQALIFDWIEAGAPLMSNGMEDR